MAVLTEHGLETIADLGIDLEEHARAILANIDSPDRWGIENGILEEIKKASSSAVMQWELENRVDDAVMAADPKYRLPRSLLEHFARILHGYYERFATDHFTPDGKSLDMDKYDIGPRLAYWLACSEGRDIGNAIIRAANQTKRVDGKRINTLEIGSAEGFVALKILEHLHSRHPELFPNLIYHSVDFAANNISMQQRQLRAFHDNVMFYCQDGTDLSNFGDDSIAFCFMNEFFDNTEQTEIWKKDGMLYALGLTRESGGWGQRLLGIPFAQSIDRRRISEYIKRNCIAEPEECEIRVINPGMERTFRYLGRIMKKGSILWIMDYIYAVPNVTYQCHHGILTDDRTYPYADLTAFVDYRDLSLFAERNGFERIELRDLSIPFDSRYHFFIVVYEKRR